MNAWGITYLAFQRCIFQLISSNILPRTAQISYFDTSLPFPSIVLISISKKKKKEKNKPLPVDLPPPHPDPGTWYSPSRPLKPVQTATWGRCQGYQSCTFGCAIDTVVPARGNRICFEYRSRQVRRRRSRKRCLWRAGD